MGPQNIAAKKSEVKKPKASTKKEQGVGVPTRKYLRKKNFKPESEKPEWPRRVRPEAVLIKPAEGVSYAAILKTLKKRVKPDEIGVTVQGTREMRSKDLWVELKCSKRDIGRLDTALKKFIGVTAYPESRSRSRIYNPAFKPRMSKIL